MKYLHDDVLAALSSYLMDCPMLDDNGFSSSGNGDSGGSSSAANTRILHGRIEAYTTKRTQQEKGYAVQLLERYVEAQESNEKEMQMASTLWLHNNNNDNNGSSSRGRSGDAREQGNMKHKRRRSQSTSEAGGDDEEEERLRLRPAGRFRSFSLDECHNKKPPLHSTTLPNKPPQPQQFMSRAFTTSAVPSSSTGGGGGHNSATLQLQQQSRRLWTDLILTLNLSFPDFDFTDHATSFAGAGGGGDRLFTAVPLQTAVNAINQKIGDNKMLRLNFWPAIDNVVGPLSQIPTVYSFIDTEDIIKSKLLPTKTQDNNTNGPSQQSQQAEEQVIWSVNYFFVNKLAKRIVFFTCIETMRPNNESLMMMPEEEEENVPATSSSRRRYDDDDDMVGGRRRRDGEMEDDEDEDDIVDHSLDEEEEEEDQSESVSNNFDMDPSMSAGGIPIG